MSKFKCEQLRITLYALRAQVLQALRLVNSQFSIAPQAVVENWRYPRQLGTYYRQPQNSLFQIPQE